MDKLNIRKILQKLGCKYTFFYHPLGEEPVYLANHDVFPSASIIKIPLLLAWLKLEEHELLHRDELCDLDTLPQVKGAGLTWLFHTRHIAFADVLLMMITLSDNLCTNLVIKRIGLERANQVFRDELGLKGTVLQRMMMDFQARSQGLENWISTADCMQLYALIEQLPAENRNWTEDLLGQCQDNTLFLRDLGTQKVSLYHKTGTLHDLRHDWGYTRGCQLFLLTWGFQDELETTKVFGKIGHAILANSEKPG